MLRFKFDKNKAVAAILYIAEALKKELSNADIYKTLKILYFADQKIYINTEGQLPEIII